MIKIKNIKNIILRVESKRSDTDKVTKPILLFQTR